MKSNKEIKEPFGKSSIKTEKLMKKITSLIVSRVGTPNLQFEQDWQDLGYWIGQLNSEYKKEIEKLKKQSFMNVLCSPDGKDLKTYAEKLEEKDFDMVVKFVANKIIERTDKRIEELKQGMKKVKP